MLKKFLSLFLILMIISFNSVAFANSSCYCREQVLCQEHLDVNKKAPCNKVTITNYRRIVCKNNVIVIAFDCKFFSKCEHAGNTVNFTIPEALYTEEGTMLLPAGTKFVGEVTNIQHPKWFNKNARISIYFRHIVLPSGKLIPVYAKPFTKDGKLKEGPWMTTGKIVLSTVTLGIIGAGAGVGFGFIPSPTKLWVGLAVGIPVGCGVGLSSALISKGLHYKAHKNEKIYIILTDDLSIMN